MYLRTTILLLFAYIAIPLSLLAQRSIQASFHEEKGPKSSVYTYCVGAGRANEGLRADWQQQLRQVKEECGFEYIRFHGLLHDDMGVYREDEEGNAEYNWFYIDQLYDFLLSIGVKPFVELSFTPWDLASGEEYIFWWKGNITPPKSYEKYYELIHRFTRHITARYGEREVRTWRFEIWNEPNLHFFFSGTQEDYFKMYQTAVKAIQDISKNYQVGGPATAGTGWVEETLSFAKEKSVPLDFIATHTYAVEGFLDEFGKDQLKLLQDSAVIIKDVKRVAGQAQENAEKPLEIHFTEWSSSYSPRDPIHDTYQNAPYVLNVLRHVDQDVTSMSYWTFTDIFEEPGPPSSPFHGGFGLLTREGLKKPTYYAYQFLNELGETELVNSDENSWVCKDDQGNVQVLIYDLHFPRQKNESNQSYFKRLHPTPKDLTPVNIKLTLPNGHYILTMKRVGYKSNDVYSAYVEAGSPHTLSPHLFHALKKEEDAMETREQIRVRHNLFERSLPIGQNELLFVTLEK